MAEAAGVEPDNGLATTVLQRFLILTALLYLAFAAGVFLIDKASHAGYEARVDQLAADSQYVAATVTSLEAHNTVCYQYVVDGTRYSDCNWSHYDAGTPVVGRTVTVFYYPGDPSISCSCDPQDEAGWLKWGPVWLGAFVAVILAPIAAWWWYYGGPPRG